jgi:indole-3-glycerol phosphate synthase
VATYLDDLLDTARERAATLHDRGEAASIHGAAEALAGQGPGHRLHAALSGDAGVSVIAEVKRASPSRGQLARGIDAATQAGRYLAGGATAISVLTEPSRFDGNLTDLTDVVNAHDAVALRKDFIVDPVMVHEAVVAGASGILLIVAALGDDELRSMHAEATRLGLDCLVEVHGEGEVERALDAGATILGVNARDLQTFELDRDAFGRIRPQLPDDVLAVAESGMRGPEDVARARDEGADAILVGEFVVTASDPTATVASLVEAGRLP